MAARDMRVIKRKQTKMVKENEKLRSKDSVIALRPVEDDTRKYVRS